MAPIPRKYVVVYGALFLTFLGIAIESAIAEGGSWTRIIVQAGRNLEPLAVIGAPLAYAVVEVGTVIAEWFLKKREEIGERRGMEQGLEQGMQQGMQQGEQRAEQLAIEADRQRRPGESLKEAMDRLRSEERN